jgi:lipopolysaccharide biosynthesis regulator YciM
MYTTTSTLEGGGKLSRDRLICGYNVARTALELDDITRDINRAKEYVKAGNYERADGLVRYVMDELQWLKVLLKTAPSTCPNVDEPMLEELKKSVDAAEEALSKKPYDLDVAKYNIEMVKVGIYLPFEKR